MFSAPCQKCRTWIFNNIHNLLLAPASSRPPLFNQPARSKVDSSRRPWLPRNICDNFAIVGLRTWTQKASASEKI